jgi:uncharacterized membrane protein YcaP (DUF421 family)
MDYPTILDPIPWSEIRIVIIQSFVLYWSVILGLKLVGRRVFGELAPQDIALLLLIAETCDIGLTPEGSGFWGSLFSLITLLVTVGIVERIKPLRELLSAKPINLVKNGEIQTDILKKLLIEEEDLNQTAREYGVSDFHAFEQMCLESGGHITGILKPEYQHPKIRKETTGI